jgi:hypothetical protein
MTIKTIFKILLLLPCFCFGQVLLTTNQIKATTDAGEGDLYKNSETNDYYIGTSEGNLVLLSPQKLNYSTTTDSLSIGDGNTVSIAQNAYISICEYIVSEGVLETKGNVFFVVPEKLNGYKTSVLTVSIFKRSGSFTQNLIVGVEIIRNGTTISINEDVSFNPSTTFRNSSNGNNPTTIQTGDLIRLDIKQSTTDLTDLPEGLSATLELIK